MMIKLISESLGKMKKVCKPQMKFVTELLSVMLSVRGKMNFRNMSRYSSYSEKTFSRNYKKEFDFEEFNQHLLSFVVKPETRLIVAFDQSFVPKSGKQTYGRGSFWNGSASKAERGLEVGNLSVVDVDYNTAYTASVQQTPPIEKQKDFDYSRVDAYVDHIRSAKKSLPKQVKHLIGDGFFAKEKFVTPVKELGLEIVSKLRIDANLKHLYRGPQKALGRPKKYDGKVDTRKLELLDFVEKIDEHSLYTVEAYSLSLKLKIKVVLVVNNKNNRRCILFSTDLSLAAKDIYFFYKSRFQIEFVFRDAKQFTGLADCQARSQSQLNYHFNASFTALNLTRIEDRLSQQNRETKRPFSMASWKTLYANERFIQSIFSMLGFDQSFIKSIPQLDELRSYGVISQWH